ncbi:SusC/RagA family TonB-linked outer membrane protein [Mucilaginibacter terrae]|uniref:SusC/RagA family TonB-linked outer membrane protein n=1 Tax=Mucilaginibacter terrae TaxID=1955052 RepID=UPI003641E274
MKKNYLKDSEAVFIGDQSPLKAVAKNLLIKKILLLILLFCASSAFAQKNVTGVVSDDNGEALVGVTVNLKGTQTTSVTDVNGKYVIRVPNNNAVIVYSYVSFVKQEITVGNRTSINVALKTDVTNLSEVVVQTGYTGSVRKIDLTGSVGSVRVGELQKAPVRSFEEALGGRVAGVQVINGDGQPGDAAEIVIRGNNSINGSNAPLYVIDGFAIENPDNNTLNPAEIESISVLKDASSTAIYGSRGANGVIIITTKRGKVGTPSVSYSGYRGFNKITQKVNLMDPYQFVKLQTEINPTTAANSYFTDGKTLESYRNIAGASFQDRIFKTGAFQNHYLALTGGTDATRYTVSGSVTDQDGIIANSGFNRYQGRATLDQKIGKKFRIGSNINFSASESFGLVPRSQNNVGGNDVTFNLLYQVWSYRPITGSLNPDDILDEFQDPDNPANSGDYRVNPISSVNNEYNHQFNNTFLATLYLEYNIAPGLVFRSTGGASLSNRRNEVFYNSFTRQGSPLTNQGRADGQNGRIDYTKVNDFTNTNILTYNKTFNKDHRINLLALAETQASNSQSFGYRAIRVPNESLGVNGLKDALAGNITPFGSATEYKLLSFGFNADYQLLGGRYLFKASARRDGSSKFKSDSRFAFFPTGAFAWRYTEESFIKKLKLFSSGKLKASYGIVGNNRINSNFPSSSLITGTNTYYPFANQLAQAYYITSLGNEKLKWESTKQLDLGLEMGLFKDRLLIEADYYNKQTYDLLLSSQLPLSSGINSIFDNIGQVSNKGFELTVTSENVRTKNFN